MCGCASLKELEEPDSIPIFVDTFQDAIFENCTELAVDVDVEDCTEHAMLVKKGIFGSSSIEACYPVRELIRREVKRLVEDNFHNTDPREKGDVCIVVRTHRTILTNHLSKSTFDLSVNIRILPANPNARPLFRKSYRAHTFGPIEDEDEVPKCVYRAIQQIMNEFLMDVSENRNLVGHFEAASEHKEAQTKKQMKGLKE